MKLKCRISGHEWDHAVCSRCGISIGSLRDLLGGRKNHPCRDGHLWTSCRCARCGEARPAEGENEFHIYEGCRCRICNHALPEESEEHRWVQPRAGARNCMYCEVCGTYRTHQFNEKDICVYCRKYRTLTLPPPPPPRKYVYTGGPCPGHEWVSAKVRFGPGWLNGYKCKICGKEKIPEIQV